MFGLAVAPELASWAAGGSGGAAPELLSEVGGSMLLLLLPPPLLLLLLLPSSLGALLLGVPVSLRGSGGGAALSEAAEGDSVAPPRGGVGWASEGDSAGAASSVERMRAVL